MEKSPYILGFNNSRDLLEKLNREKSKVLNSKDSQEVMDNFFNFIITAYSIKDWIKKEFGSLNEKKIYDEYPELGICQDTANASKHFIISEEHFNSKHRNKKNKKAKLKKITFELKPYGKEVYGGGGYGGISTNIQTEESNTSYTIHTFIDKVITAWKKIINDK